MDLFGESQWRNRPESGAEWGADSTVIYSCTTSHPPSGPSVTLPIGSSQNNPADTSNTKIWLGGKQPTFLWANCSVSACFNQSKDRAHSPCVWKLQSTYYHLQVTVLSVIPIERTNAHRYELFQYKVRSFAACAVMSGTRFPLTTWPSKVSRAAREPQAASCVVIKSSYLQRRGNHESIRLWKESSRECSKHQQASDTVLTYFHLLTSCWETLKFSKQNDDVMVIESRFLIPKTNQLMRKLLLSLLCQFNQKK